MSLSKRSRHWKERGQSVLAQQVPVWPQLLDQISGSALKAPLLGVFMRIDALLQTALKCIMPSDFPPKLSSLHISLSQLRVATSTLSSFQHRHSPFDKLLFKPFSASTCRWVRVPSSNS